MTFSNAISIDTAALLTILLAWRRRVTDSPPAAPELEQVFPSTTWEWRRVRVRAAPAGQDTARAQRGRWHGLTRWPRTQGLTVTIAYRGGPQSWWLVTARGRHGVFPGCAALEDVMAMVFNEAAWHADPAEAFPRYRKRGTKPQA